MKNGENEVKMKENEVKNEKNEMILLFFDVKRMYIVAKRRKNEMKIRSFQMQGSGMFVGTVIEKIFMLLGGVCCVVFGLKYLLSKNEKKRNKKKGIFLLVAGICLVVDSCFFFF